ncbi:MAG: methylated-DNA--[protein]-cysteine S-methyltransferase [Bacteroidia bacterium]|nr:methylated-DNA--[protein]-cysteine S-methyltransferase [Bacteroidia bacterium]
MEDQSIYYASPIGILRIKGGDKKGITGIELVENKAENNDNVPGYLQECVEQLDEYFKGKRQQFTVSINPCGTAFQKMVWDYLQKIPYGETVSYLEAAKAVGNKNATRAIGNANKMNKIPIIIPCHRVIGSNGKLTGFGLGIWRKEWLLEFERKNVKGY